MRYSLLFCLCLISIIFQIDGTVFIRKRRDAETTQVEYRICVPQEFFSTCTDMIRDFSGKNSEDLKEQLRCVAARDRFHCLQLIQRRDADLVPVDPEDMWVAAKIPDEDFQVFDEVRTKEEPDAEYRYEAVAVVHKDLEFKSFEDLRGLKSCHTGIGRNVGYKIPITRLRQKGLIGTLSDPELSPRENELKALSSLFSKACIVGKWSPDPDINKRLKKTYSNLCALCEKPTVCDYPDNFSGYDGALRCLAHNGGQIAWTKVIYVKKFFGLPVGSAAAIPTKENREKFAYLCPDGTKKPITENTECRWAARPWQGFVTNGDLIASAPRLHETLKKLSQFGEAEKASWLETILTVNNKSTIVSNSIISPIAYLDKANYTDVISRDYGPPKKTIRFCVTNRPELNKCRELSTAAFSRNIRPEFDCIETDSLMECLKVVRDNGADIITVDASLVDLGQREYNLRPIVAEQYGELGGLYYAVAVVRKSSTYKSFGDLRGARSCHTGYGHVESFSAPLYTLIKNGLIHKNRQCPNARALAEFFSGGNCLPGALDSENNMDESNPESLCSICAGNLDGKESKKFICANNDKEAFFDNAGAFRCLAMNKGDVAFVKHTTVMENTDGLNKEKWAASLKSKDFELLCPNGGRAPISDFSKCYMAKIPSRMVVTSNAKNNNEIEEIRHAIIDAGQMFSKRSDLFKLFGIYDGKRDLLFKDSVTGLISVDSESPLQQDYVKMLEVIRACDNN